MAKTTIGTPRVCRKCGATDSRRWNGRECWECQKARVAAWKRANPERIFTPQERAKRRKAAYIAYWNNLDLGKARAAQYRVDHPDRVAAWFRKNAERMIQHVANRRARMLEADGVTTVEDWERIKRAHGNRCVDCGRSDVKLTRGHIVPLIRGGSNYPSNIVPQCKSCNSRQHTSIWRPKERIA